jgi:ribosomal protein S18 acetylase RimI-like enzyme
MSSPDLNLNPPDEPAPKNGGGSSMPMFLSDPNPDYPFIVRSFADADLPACRKLYSEGLLGGKLAENDTGFDIDDIPLAYMKHPGSHFWVAQIPDGQVVGMIGVQRHEQGDGEIRRLRVSRAHRRRGIGRALVEAAIKFCAENECLKVTLDTFIDREPAVKLFERFRFNHSKTKKVGEKEMLYFYLDLYQGDGRPPKQE